MWEQGAHNRADLRLLLDVVVVVVVVETWHLELLERCSLGKL